MKFLVFLFCLLTYFSIAQPAIKFELAYQGYSNPVDIANPEDGSDRLFIVEKAGKIKVIENGIQLGSDFLDIESSVNSGGERGLLGLVFHPNYETNGFFFINYVDNSNKTTISRFKVSSDANIADASSEKILLQIQQPRNNHNAGDLNFSPIDNYLYIALGDGGGSGDPDCLSQDSSSMLGKILRIDVRTDDIPPYYNIPSTNPYIAVAAVADEIWAFGLRNPWRVSFDRTTGDYWLADVGQGDHEEVNFLPAGTTGGINFGWNFKEGMVCFTDGDFTNCTTEAALNCNTPNVFTDPIIAFNRTLGSGARSITGGFVYRGCRYPEMLGRYICTDFVTDNSWHMDSNGNAVQFDGGAESVSSYGEDYLGELYVASISGSIYSVIDNNVAKSLTLTSADFPLSGTYKATSNIVVTDLLDQNFNGVKFIAEEVIFNDDVRIPLASDILISNDFCNN